MEYFEYKTINPIDGKITSSIITADDIESAAEALKKRGETIVEIGPLKDLFNLRKIIYSMSVHVNKRTTAEFFTMLSFLLEAGMSLYESLVSIRDSSINNKLRFLTRVISDEVRQGASLSSAMKKSDCFPESVIEQINSGEEAGNVPDALKRLSAQTQQELEFSSKIKSAFIYPAVIGVVMVAVLWVLLAVVVPTLAETLLSMGSELPTITKIVIAISEFVASGTLFIVMAIVAAIITFRVMMKNQFWRHEADRIKLKLPIIGNMLVRIDMSRFCRNLSAMQQSGIALVSSLKITAGTIKNKSLSKSVEKAGRLVEMSGMDLSAALSKSGKFPIMMLQLISVGISSGQICGILDKIAEQYEKEVEVMLKRISSLVEPALILIVSILAGIIVVAVFLPILSLVDSF